MLKSPAPESKHPLKYYFILLRSHHYKVKAFFYRYFASHAMLRRHFVLAFLKMSRDKNSPRFLEILYHVSQPLPGSSPNDPPFWKSSRRRPWGRGWRKAVFVANFVVQLDNFWTAGRYFNKLYFINVCVKLCLILVFSFCRLNICCLILSLAQTQNLKLISFVCRSPVSENRTSNSVFY